MICYSVGPCALGQLLVAWSDEGVCAVELADTPEQLLNALKTLFPGQSFEAVNAQASPYLSPIAQFIDAPHSAPPDLPLHLEGTAFQRAVWQALRQIPTGQTLSYSQLARKLDQPSAARAVANACGANKLAVLIPCHRVVRRDGTPGGYRWGLERKRALLQREADASR